MLLFTMAMCCGEVARCLEVLSRWWPCLLPRCNTAYGLIRQADLIEILMSTLRGTSLLFADSELKTLREVSRQTRFQELCSLMQTVHLLKARLTDGYLKHKKETIRRCVHNACLYPSPPAHHRCGYNRTMCTSRPRHTVAAVTTALCVHPSPHVPLQHRWARYWEVDELAALWESGDAFVQGQVVTGFWEHFVFETDLRSSEEPNALNFRLKQVTPFGR